MNVIKSSLLPTLFNSKLNDDNFNSLSKNELNKINTNKIQALKELENNNLENFKDYQKNESKEHYIESFIGLNLINDYFSNNEDELEENNDPENDSDNDSKNDSDNDSENDSDNDSDNDSENNENFDNDNNIENFSNMTGCPIVFGDILHLAITPEINNTSNCGKYGCRVANASGNWTQRHMKFQHGKQHPQSFQIVDSAKTGSILNYGEGFYLKNVNINDFLSYKSNDKYINKNTYWAQGRNCRRYLHCYNVSGRRRRRWGRRRRGGTRRVCKWQTKCTNSWNKRYRGSTKFYILPGVGKKIGDVVKYDEQVFIGVDGNGNIANANSKKLKIDGYPNCRAYASSTGGNGIYLRKPSGQPCNILQPKLVTTGDFSIKKITVRCDDAFHFFIQGKEYKGSGWTNTFRFNNVPLIDKSSGFTIAIKCYNGGGPGSLIMMIELNNGSVIFTDETWDSAVDLNPGSVDYFLRYPNRFTYGNEWQPPNIIGYNQKGEMRWNNRIISHYDNYFVDKNFSPLSKWIWAGDCFRRGWVYFKKTIGEPPSAARCSKNLTFGEALCYLEGNPDIKNWIKMATGDYRYVYNPKLMGFWDHEREAIKQGGHLASIHGQSEVDNLKTFWSGKSVYIGGVRKSQNRYDRSSSTWKWTDGSPWDFNGFHSHYEPNNWGNSEDVIHFWPHGKWNDIRSSYPLPGLYKIPNENSGYTIDKAVDMARNHWKKYGCSIIENRKYTCSKPPDIIGNFNYKGCYNDSYNQRDIPNFRGNVTSLAKCSEYAIKNRDRLFGVTDGEKCYTGNDLENITKNTNASTCSTLGKKMGYQVYYRDLPYDPLMPKLENKNFSNGTENFENKNNNYNYNNIIIIFIIIILVLLFIYITLKK